MKPTYIYLLQLDCEPYYKIGVTSDLIRRKDNLQTGNPFELRYFHTVRCKSRYIAYSTETTLHHRYKRYHIRLEWYHLPLDKLLDAVSIISQVGETVSFDKLKMGIDNQCRV